MYIIPVLLYITRIECGNTTQNITNNSIFWGNFTFRIDKYNPESKIAKDNIILLWSITALLLLLIGLLIKYCITVLCHNYKKTQMVKALSTSINNMENISDKDKRAIKDNIIRTLSANVENDDDLNECTLVDSHQL